MDTTCRRRRWRGPVLGLLAVLALGWAAAACDNGAPPAASPADDAATAVEPAMEEDALTAGDGPAEAPPGAAEPAPEPTAEPATADDASPPADVVPGDDADDAGADPWGGRRRDLLIELSDPVDTEFLREFGQTVGERRGLPLLAEVPVYLLRRHDVAEYFASLYEVDDLEEAVFAETLYRLLGIIERDTAYVELLQDLFVGLVLGFYDEDVDAFIIVSSNDQITRRDLDTISHEFVHALQDQHFDLGARFDDAPTTDADTVLRFVLEGDARLSEGLLQDLVRALAPSLPPTADQLPGAGNVPEPLRRLFNAPYTTGLEAVRRIVSQGGANAIDAYIAEPPASTEQLLHPEKLAAREPPLAVPPPDLLGALPGWEELGTDTLGEFVARTVLERAVGSGSAAAAAAGWGGDALAVYRHADGREALAWHTRWDTSGDAEEFRLALEAWMRTTVGGDAVRGDDGTYAVREGSLAAWSVADGVEVSLVVGDAEAVAALSEAGREELTSSGALVCDAARMQTLMGVAGKDGSVVAETPCFTVAH